MAVPYPVSQHCNLLGRGVSGHAGSGVEMCEYRQYFGEGFWLSGLLLAEVVDLILPLRCASVSDSRGLPL